MSDRLNNTAVLTPSYWELNTRLGWRPVEHLLLSLVGSNLLSIRHLEFPDSATHRPQVQRAVYAEAFVQVLGLSFPFPQPDPQVNFLYTLIPVLGILQASYRTIVGLSKIESYCSVFFCARPLWGRLSDRERLENVPHTLHERSSSLLRHAPVAQLDRAPHYGCGGCKFNSCRAHS